MRLPLSLQTADPEIVRDNFKKIMEAIALLGASSTVIRIQDEVADLTGIDVESMCTISVYIKATSTDTYVIIPNPKTFADATQNANNILWIFHVAPDSDVTDYINAFIIVDGSGGTVEGNPYIIFSEVGQTVIIQSNGVEYKVLFDSSTISGLSSVHVDGTTITGDGTSGSPLIGHTSQVQSDWNQASSSSPAYIQNKPSIPTSHPIAIVVLIYSGGSWGNSSIITEGAFASSTLFGSPGIGSIFFNYGGIDVSDQTKVLVQICTLPGPGVYFSLRPDSGTQRMYVEVKDSSGTLISYTGDIKILMTQLI